MDIIQSQLVEDANRQSVKLGDRGGIQLETITHKFDVCLDFYWDQKSSGAIPSYQSPLFQKYPSNSEVLVAHIIAGGLTAFMLDPVSKVKAGVCELSLPNSSTLDSCVLKTVGRQVKRVNGPAIHNHEERPGFRLLVTFDPSEISAIFTPEDHDPYEALSAGDKEAEAKVQKLETWILQTLFTKLFEVGCIGNGCEVTVNLRRTRNLRLTICCYTVKVENDTVQVSVNHTSN